MNSKTISLEDTIKEGRLYFVGDRLPPNWFEAFRYWLPLAEAGDPKAQYNVARCFDRGDGTDRDSTQALHWYQKAAAQDDPRAHYNLHIAYSKDGIASSDPALAEAHLQKAASLNERRALMNLGTRALAEGQKEEAIALFQRSHDKGFQYAWQGLATAALEVVRFKVTRKIEYSGGSSTSVNITVSSNGNVSTHSSGGVSTTLLAAIEASVTNHSPWAVRPRLLFRSTNLQSGRPSTLELVFSEEISPGQSGREKVAVPSHMRFADQEYCALGVGNDGTGETLWFQIQPRTVRYAGQKVGMSRPIIHGAAATLAALLWWGQGALANPNTQAEGILATIMSGGLLLFFAPASLYYLAVDPWWFGRRVLRNSLRTTPASETSGMLRRWPRMSPRTVGILSVLAFGLFAVLYVGNSSWWGESGKRVAAAKKQIPFAKARARNYLAECLRVQGIALRLAQFMPRNLGAIEKSPASEAARALADRLATESTREESARNSAIQMALIYSCVAAKVPQGNANLGAWEAPFKTLYVEGETPFRSFRKDYLDLVYVFSDDSEIVRARANELEHSLRRVLGEIHQRLPK